jgi:hypothetical protein
MGMPGLPGSEDAALFFIGGNQPTVTCHKRIYSIQSDAYPKHSYMNTGKKQEAIGKFPVRENLNCSSAD